MKNLILAFSIVINTLTVNALYGQDLYNSYQNINQEYLFKNKINNPIEIEVTKQNDSYVFYANNKSNYHYQVKIEFQYMANLSPKINTRETVILSGKNRLFNLRITDVTQSASYQYETSYKIGAPSKNVDKNYPYLIPLSTSSSFDLAKHPDKENTYVNDFFKLKKGDTVFCMRKGIIVASPNEFKEADRISQNKSLEIMHQDGTIMIYENLDPNMLFVNPKDTVFPGQALGIINEKAVLEVYLYMIQENNNLKRLNINYYQKDGKIAPFDLELAVSKIDHPKEVIIKEMSKREIKKNGLK